MRTPRRALRPRGVIGPTLVVVGVVHTGLAPLLHPAAVRGVLRAGVLDAVRKGSPPDPERALAF